VRLHASRTEKCGEGSGAKSVLESNQNGVAFALMRKHLVAKGYNTPAVIAEKVAALVK
jgi:hypothetical protein